jgi:CubicO group peptidase (beta-lactamase class C family)
MMRTDKRRTPVAFLLLLLLLAAGCSSSGAPPDAGEVPLDLASDVSTGDGPGDGPATDAPGAAAFAQLVAITQQELQQRGVPGAALAVVIDGKLAHARGLGVKKQGGSDAVTADSLFSLASVSKMFTGALVLALADKGKLKTGDAAAAMIPKLTFTNTQWGAKITLDGLLTHTAGAGHVYSDQLIAAGLDWSSPDSLVQAFEKIKWPLWAPPGAVWNYSNLGYSMAGAALQKKLGTSYAGLLKTHVLTPAKMARSTAEGGEAEKVDHTFGHGGGAPVQASSASLYLDGPNNGVFSSARELARFAEMLLAGGGSVLSKTAVTRMSSALVDLSHETTGLGYGYGLYRLPRDGVVVVYHSGTNRGWTANLTLVPAKKFAVVVLMNASGGAPINVSNRALELFLGLPPYQKPAFSSTPAERQALAGTYVDPFKLGSIKVTATAGGQLSATFAKWSYTSTLGQWGKRAFSITTGGTMQQELGSSFLTLSFYVDSAGKGQYLVSRLGVAKAQ